MTSIKIDQSVKPLQQVIWETVPLLARQIHQQADRAILPEYEMTRSQFHVLLQISHGRNTISSLANQDSISLPAVSRQVDELERKRLITRQRDPQDRRIVHLALTDEGRQLKEIIRARVLEWLTSKVEPLSPAEQESIRQGLDLLASIFVDEAAPCPHCHKSLSIMEPR